jgi:hypothetical protein
VIERQQHGTIIVMNAIGDDTEVFVDPKKDVKAGKLDDRVSRSTGSLKISNLVPDTYVVEVKLKVAGTRPVKCAGVCRINLALKACETVKLRADADGLRKLSESDACEAPESKEKTATAKKKKRTTRAVRHSWR